MILANLAAVLLYLASVWLILRRHRQYLVFFGYLAFLNAWALISCFYNDLGIYNLELFRHTETTLATARLAAFGIVFNLGFLALASLVGDRPLVNRDYQLAQGRLRLGHLRLTGYVAAVIAVVYLGYTLIEGGIPFLSGIGRQAFFEQAGPIERTVLIYGPLLAFLCGYFRPHRPRVAFSSLVMLLFVVYAILVGNKFSFLVLVLVCYYAPVYVRRAGLSEGNWRLTLRRLLVLAAFAVGILGFVFVSYVRSQGGGQLAFTYMYNRILAFQGETWWAVDHDIQNHGRYDPDHWKAELDAIIGSDESDGAETGLRYLMIKVLGPERAYPIIDGGYLYTGAYPAILIATFPYALALAIQLLAGCVYFLMLYYLHYCILFRHAVRSAVMVLVLVPFLVTLINADLSGFFTLGLAVKLAVLSLLELGAGTSLPRRLETVTTQETTV